MTQINGKEVTVEALAKWLEQLPDDYRFSRTGKQYSCDCYVGRYINQDSRPEYAQYYVGYATAGRALADERIPLENGVSEVVGLYDIVEEEDITAAELRKRIVVYILLGEAEE